MFTGEVGTFRGTNGTSLVGLRVVQCERLDGVVLPSNSFHRTSYESDYTPVVDRRELDNRDVELVVECVLGVDCTWIRPVAFFSLSATDGCKVLFR